MPVNNRTFDRRRFLKGEFLNATLGHNARPGATRFIHISSAVVTAYPDRCAEIARQIEELPSTEVHAVEGSKIVIVMEAGSTGEIGSRLTTIALMEGVFSANLVFEQIETVDDIGAET